MIWSEFDEKDKSRKRCKRLTEDGIKIIQDELLLFYFEKISQQELKMDNFFSDVTQ